MAISFRWGLNSNGNFLKMAVNFKWQLASDSG